MFIDVFLLSDIHYVCQLYGSYHSEQLHIWDFHGLQTIDVLSGKRLHNEQDNHHAINWTTHYG